MPLRCGSATPSTVELSDSCPNVYPIAVNREEAIAFLQIFHPPLRYDLLLTGLFYFSIPKYILSSIYQTSW